MAQIASVAAITGTGKAFAVNEQGISRELKAGDVLQKGETIRTVGDVRVELVMDDGRLLAVAPNQVLRLDENVTESDQRPTAQDSAVGAPAATADTVLQALERGTDLSTELEATAAGLGGGGADGGSSFVQLLRIVEGVDPLAYNYTYTAPELPPDLQANPDVLTSTTMVLTADPVVLEGSPGVTYTVTLGDPAVSDMTVTLSNGAVIVIPAGSTTGSVLVPVQGDDVYKDGETLQASVDTVQGGGFLEITVTDQNVITVVNDTIDTTPVTVGVSVVNGDGDVNNVIEGNQLTFRFSVNAAPQSDLILNVTIGGVAQTVTIAAGSLFTDVTVASRADENYVQGATTVTGTVNSVSLTDNGNFENLSIDSASATATIVDDGDVTTASISTSNVTENDAGVTFNISLSNVPQGTATAQVLVGETTYNVAIDANGKGTLFVATADPDPYKDPSSVTATVTGVTGGNYETVSVAGATATADITDIVGEGDTTTVSLATANVNEDAASVTFTATLSNPGETAVTIVTNLGNIVIAAGDTSGTLVINTQDSDVYLDASSLTATVTGVTGGNFEAVDFSEATATAQITDTINTTTVSLATANVNEDAASVTFTATLSNPGETAVTIVTNLGNIVIAAGDTSGTLVINTQDSDVYLDASSLTATVSGVSGGNFEAVDFSKAAATAQIADTIDTTKVSVDRVDAEGQVITGDVVEGNPIIFRFSVDNAPQTALTLNVTINGVEQQVTIAADTTSSSVTVDSRADDYVIQGNSSVTATVMSVDPNANGNYENLSIDGATSSAIVVDDIDGVEVRLTVNTASVVEGGSVTYTATLYQTGTNTVINNPYGSAITVTLNNGQSIEIASGASSNTSAAYAVATAAAGNADDYVVDQTATGEVSVAITGATSAATEESLTFSSTPAVTDVTDDTDGIEVRLTVNTASVVEGGSVTYTATLYQTGTNTVINNPYGSAITVTLNNGQSIEIASGASSNTSAAYAVATAAAGNADDYVVDQTATGEVSVAITGATSAATEESLTFSSTPAVTDVTDDTDGIEVRLTVNTASVVEGGSVTYTATLYQTGTNTVINNPYGSAITVTLNNGQSIEIASGASSNTSAAYAVATAAAGNADDYVVDQTATGEVSVAITGATSAATEESLTFSSTPAVTDVTDDTDGIEVRLTVNTASVVEGGSVTYTATLYQTGTNTVINNPYGSAITVTLNNGQSIEIASGASSNTSAAYAVATAAAGNADDYVVDQTATGEVSVAITGATSAATEESLTFSSTPAVTDVTDDTDGIEVRLTVNTASVVEGGSVTYTATLYQTGTNTVINNPYGSAITVTLNNGQSIEIASGASSNTSAAYAVATAAAGNADDYVVDQTATGEVSVAITGATSAATEESLTFSSTPAVTDVTDDTDGIEVRLTVNTASVVEGGSVTYTATLYQTGTNTVINNPYGSAITVTLNNGQSIEIASGASSNTSAAYAVATAAAGNADDYVVDQTATGEVSVAITGATSAATEESLTFSSTPAVTDVTDDTDGIEVRLTVNTASVVEGGSVTYTATLYQTGTNTVINNPYGSAITVTLNNGQSIEIASGASSNTSAAYAVATAAAGNADDYVVDQTATGEVSVAITGATSAATEESLTFSSTPAVTDVTDDTDGIEVRLTVNTASVVEGGSVTYTATLYQTGTNTVINNPYGSAITVTLNNGQSIEIASGASSNTSAAYAVATAAAGNADDYVVDQTATGEVSVAITGATSAATEESLTFSSTPAVTDVTDDTDGIEVRLTVNTASVVEGGSVTYTATLYQTGTNTVINNPYGSAITVTLNNGQSIEIASGASSNTSAAYAVATAAAGNADDYVVDQTATGEVSVAITGATSAATEESLTFSSTPAVTDVTDDTDGIEVRLTVNTASVVEGGSVTYTATLYQTGTNTVINNPYGSAITVTLNNGQSIEIASGASSNTSAAYAVATAAAGNADDYVVDQTATGEVSVAITGATSAATEESLTFSSTPAVTDVTDDTDGIEVRLTADLTTVVDGQSVTYTATLWDVATNTVINNPYGTAMTVTLSNNQTITIAAGASSGSLAVPVDETTATQVSMTIASADSSAAEESLTVDGTAVLVNVDYPPVEYGAGANWQVQTGVIQPKGNITFADGGTIHFDLYVKETDLSSSAALSLDPSKLPVGLTATVQKIFGDSDESVFRVEFTNASGQPVTVSQSDQLGLTWSGVSSSKDTVLLINSDEYVLLNNDGKSIKLATDPTYGSFVNSTDVDSNDLTVVAVDNRIWLSDSQSGQELVSAVTPAYETGQTVDPSAGNDIIYGNFGVSKVNDTNDTLSGGIGNDLIDGRAGNDILDGGAGNDAVFGGLGNDLISGGAGNDILGGGYGSDTFKWGLNDDGSDKITDFILAPVATNGDVLNLSDLLVGEENAANLSGYLTLTSANSGADTVINVDPTGLGTPTQTITLEGVTLADLQDYTGKTVGLDIINELIVKGNLKTDM